MEPQQLQDNTASVLCHSTVGTSRPGTRLWHQQAVYRPQQHWVPGPRLPQAHSMLSLDHRPALLEQQEPRSSLPQHRKLQTIDTQQQVRSKIINTLPHEVNKEPRSHTETIHHSVTHVVKDSILNNAISWRDCT